MENLRILSKAKQRGLIVRGHYTFKRKVENRVLFDWITFSCKCEKEYILSFLGLLNVSWTVSLGSRMHYAERWQFDGVSIHFTPHYDDRHTSGCCVEMSGQGCRDFETYGTGDWKALFDLIQREHFNITRLDVAYDDFDGLLDIKQIRTHAMNTWYTCRMQKITVNASSEDGTLEHFGYSITHGSRRSNILVRIYDKRAERYAFDYPHWVRCEISLRDVNAMNFIFSESVQHLSIPERYAGVLLNYLNYRQPSSIDSNKSRWDVCSWWLRFLNHAEAISVWSKLDVQYNKSRLDDYIYHMAINAIKTSILCDGVVPFVRTIFSEGDYKMKSKYQNIIDKQQNSEQIKDILERSTSEQADTSLMSILEYLDYKAING